MSEETSSVPEEAPVPETLTQEAPAPEVLAREAPVPEASEQEAPVPEAAAPEPVLALQAPADKPPAEKRERRKAKSGEKAAVRPAAAARDASLPPAQAAGGSGGAAEGPSALYIGGLAAYDADAVDRRPVVSRRVLPEYPEKARRQGVRGRVEVRLIVDASGNPRDCTVHRAEPAGYFEEAALEAARRTRFIPGEIKGRAVNTVVLIPFVFAIR
ncbi:MAG: TonB family protein [Desulfovibrio sp.]|nr:TonB family protein [Desulfovibrio sp.]